MKIISFIQDEEVIEKILNHLGLWEMKAQPPPKQSASLVTMHFDYCLRKYPMSLGFFGEIF